jgi:hypothetical protein
MEEKARKNSWGKEGQERTLQVDILSKKMRDIGSRRM